MSNNLIIRNCRLFNFLDDKETVSIQIEDGIIKEIGNIDESSPHDNILDVEGRIIAPGFIDIHIQGAGGSDVLEGTEEALQNISRTCARFGTTGFLATTIYHTFERFTTIGEFDFNTSPLAFLKLTSISSVSTMGNTNLWRT